MSDLTSEAAAKITRPGLHRASKRLYLQVSPSGAKSWVFRYSFGGRIRSMGLGPFPDVTISKAKAKADKQNAILADGIDPIAKRDAEATANAKAKEGTTFRDLATIYIAAHTPSWKNTKYATQWTTSLKADVYPLLGDKPVVAITVDDVLAVLRPIWTQKHESATRLRSRIAAVLSAAKAKGLRAGPNPAAWADNLKHLLPTISRSRRIVHFRALPYAEVPALMSTLRVRSGLSALALRFTILTACRTSEMRGATWDEFDLDAKVWTVPGSRIKSGRTHRVPLSDEVVSILQALKGLSKSWVFPGRKGKSLSDNALLILLERMGLGAKTTAHGFRSAFRMWAAEQTNYPREICEQALAHSTQDEVEAAYMRSDHYGKRAELMRDWAAFVAPQIATAKAAE